MKNEKILDSGEVYKDPKEEDIRNLLPLEFEEKELEIERTPLAKIGNNSTTHKYTRIKEDKLVFKSTVSIVGELMKFLFLLTMLAVFVFALVGAFNELEAEPIVILAFITCFFLFQNTLTIIGIKKKNDSNYDILFDKSLGLHWNEKLWWIGRRKIKEKERVAIQIKDIKAIQLLEKKYFFAKNSYELNLILKDNTRKNLIDHADYSTIYNDAKLLSEFLEVPLYT